MSRYYKDGEKLNRPLFPVPIGYPINTFFPSNAKPYLRMRSCGTPRAISCAAYCFSSICTSADCTVSSSVASSSGSCTLNSRMMPHKCFFSPICIKIIRFLLKVLKIHQFLKGYFLYREIITFSCAYFAVVLQS